MNDTTLQRPKAMPPSTEFEMDALTGRIAEIEAELLAYREGWMQFDEEHVRHLQRERIALLRTQAGSDTN